MGLLGFKDILLRVRSRYPAFARRLQEAQSLQYWKDAVGPQIAKHTSALKIQKGILFVEVNHPVWKIELHHRKEDLIARLNEAAKANPPKEGDPVEFKDLFLVDSQAVPKSQKHTWIQKPRGRDN